MTVIPIPFRMRIAGAASRLAIGLSLTVLALFPGDLAAQGQPTPNGPEVPVALWWIGAAVLGLVIVYAIMRNRTRTPADKNLTDRATKDLYAREERDRVRSGSD
jgi:hypothetical protein